MVLAAIWRENERGDPAGIDVVGAAEGQYGGEVDPAWTNQRPVIGLVLVTAAILNLSERDLGVARRRQRDIRCRIGAIGKILLSCRPRPAQSQLRTRHRAFVIGLIAIF